MEISDFSIFAFGLPFPAFLQSQISIIMKTSDLGGINSGEKNSGKLKNIKTSGLLFHNDRTNDNPSSRHHPQVERANTIKVKAFNRSDITDGGKRRKGKEKLKMKYIPLAIATIGIILAFCGIISIAGASGEVMNYPSLSQVSGIYSLFGIGFFEIVGGIILAVLGWILARKTSSSG